MREIVQKENPVLRKIAKEIPIGDIGSTKIQKIIKEMQEALHSQDDGLAIAGPQIGEELRIFIISGSLWSKKNNTNPPDKIYINPIYIKKSIKKVEKKGEGCLSIRWKYGTVKRHSNVTIKAYNENGLEFIESAGGLQSHIFQHEIDHLDGVLFTDKATNIEDHEPHQS